MSAEREARLRAATSAHRIVLAAGGGAASELRGADVAFGQPPVAEILESPKLRWVHLSSAGYGTYDRADVRQKFAERGAVLTKSSFVYASPCAEHVLAFMMTWARQLPPALDMQRGARGWPQEALRRRSRLVENQRVTLFGFGSIGARLVELLRPLTPHVTGVRRTLRGDERIPTLTWNDPQLGAALAASDHVVNLLPGIPETARFFDARRFAAFKPGAIFYNVGRGTTVDQDALIKGLESGLVGAALLDVTDPEPLPPEHALWRAPNCFITPHSAGGHHDEEDRLVDHFIANVRRFERSEPVLDRAF